MRRLHRTRKMLLTKKLALWIAVIRPEERHILCSKVTKLDSKGPPIKRTIKECHQPSATAIISLQKMRKFCPNRMCQKTLFCKVKPIAVIYNICTSDARVLPCDKFNCVGACPGKSTSTKQFVKWQEKVTAFTKQGLQRLKDMSATRCLLSYLVTNVTF